MEKHVGLFYNKIFLSIVRTMEEETEWIIHLQNEVNQVFVKSKQESNPELESESESENEILNKITENIIEFETIQQQIPKDELNNYLYLLQEFISQTDSTTEIRRNKLLKLIESIPELKELYNYNDEIITQPFTWILILFCMVCVLNCMRC